MGWRTGRDDRPAGIHVIEKYRPCLRALITHKRSRVYIKSLWIEIFSFAFSPAGTMLRRFGFPCTQSPGSITFKCSSSLVAHEPGTLIILFSKSFSGRCLLNLLMSTWRRLAWNFHKHGFFVFFFTWHIASAGMYSECPRRSRATAHRAYNPSQRSSCTWLFNASIESVTVSVNQTGHICGDHVRLSCAYIPYSSMILDLFQLN